MKKYILIVSLLTLTVSACKRDRYEHPVPLPQSRDWTNRIEELYNHNNAKITITEGASGTLTYKQGDCMPMINPKTTTCKEFPVKGAIRMYHYVLEKDVTRDNERHITNVNSTLVATAQTDAEGFYQLSLPPGKYSLIMEYKGKLYNFSSDGYSGLHPVTVTANTVVRENARIDRAVY